VAALPRWLVEDYGSRIPVRPVQLGEAGIPKQIFLGLRERDRDVDYLNSFMKLASEVRWS
jgi:LysR family transcriptional regulator for metE and metH